MRKICVVINSRANYARIKSVLVELRDSKDCELQIVVGASALLFKYGNVVEIIKKDGFKVNKQVYTAVEGNEPIVMAKTTGLALLELSQVFYDLKPDIVLTIADRHETIATAIAASYMNIPVAHTQGGEITGSVDELVRHACTKLAHIHFPSTKKSEKNILQMGEEAQRVFMVGCPALDIIESVSNLTLEKVLIKHDLNPAMFKSQNFLVVLYHPDTQYFLQAKTETIKILSAMKELNLPVIWLWPNIDSGTDFISKELRTFKENNLNSKIKFVRNFTAEDYIVILNNSLCIVGNSSSGIRESSRTGTPSVSLGSRQFGREHAENVIFMKDFEVKTLLDSIKIQINHGKFESSNLYGDGLAGKRIAEILLQVDLVLQKKFVELD